VGLPLVTAIKIRATSRYQQSGRVSHWFGGARDGSGPGAQLYRETTCLWFIMIHCGPVSKCLLGNRPSASGESVNQEAKVGGRCGNQQGGNNPILHGASFRIPIRYQKGPDRWTPRFLSIGAPTQRWVMPQPNGRRRPVKRSGRCWLTSGQRVEYAFHSLMPIRNRSTHGPLLVSPIWRQ
jgi:hypothetical protein